MGMLGMALGLSAEEEKKLKLMFRKGLVDFKPEEMKKQIADLQKKLEISYQTGIMNNQLLNIMAIYMKEQNPEAWEKAKTKFEEKQREAARAQLADKLTTDEQEFS